MSRGTSRCQGICVVKSSMFTHVAALHRKVPHQLVGQYFNHITLIGFNELCCGAFNCHSLSWLSWLLRGWNVWYLYSWLRLESREPSSCNLCPSIWEWGRQFCVTVLKFSGNATNCGNVWNLLFYSVAVIKAIARIHFPLRHWPQ